jgi:hypothetical protein
MTPKGADLAATDLIEVSTLEAGSYVTKSITGQELIDAIPLPPSGLTIGTTPIASGTIGRVLFEGTGNVLQQSANLFWDNTNGRLGIGTSTPLSPLHVTGNTFIQYATPRLTIYPTSNTQTSGVNVGASGEENRAFMGHIGSSSTFGTTNSAYFGSPSGYALSFGIGNTIVGRFATTGNLLINTTTDAGFKLDVNGWFRADRGYFITGIDTNLISLGDGFNNNNRIQYNTTSGLFSIKLSASNILTAVYNGDTVLAPVRNTVDNLGDVVIQGGGSERARFKAIGNIGFGTNAPNASSLLDLTSTTKGFLPPRMTTTQRNAIASPAAGLIVYDTTLNLPHFFNGTIWVSL